LEFAALFVKKIYADRALSNCLWLNGNMTTMMKSSTKIR